MGIIWPLGVRVPAPAPAPNPKMRRSSTDETPYRRSPSLDSKSGSPPHRYSGEYEYHSTPFVFGLRTPGSKKSKASYTTAQGRKYVVFYLDLSFIFLLELRRCRMAEGCLRALRYGMVFFNLLFWVSAHFTCHLLCLCIALAYAAYISERNSSSNYSSPVLFQACETQINKPSRSSTAYSQNDNPE